MPSSPAAGRRPTRRGPRGRPGRATGERLGSLRGRLTPGHRLFGPATPGPGHHTPTGASNPAPSPARAWGRAGHSSIAATLGTRRGVARYQPPGSCEQRGPQPARRGSAERGLGFMRGTQVHLGGADLAGAKLPGDWNALAQPRDRQARTSPDSGNRAAAGLPAP